MYSVLRSVSSAILFCIALVLVPQVQAQTPVLMPDGEAVVSVNIIPDVLPNTDVRLCATRGRVYASALTGGAWSSNALVYDQLPLNRRIMDACLRQGETGTTRFLALLLDNGDVILLNFDLTTQSLTGAPKVFAAPTVNPGNGFNQSTFRKVLLSSLLVVQYGSNVYFNTLDNHGYSQDTTGLRGATINDVNFSRQDVIVAATNKGLFSYDAFTNKWSRTTNLDTNLSIATVLYARDGRVFAATSNRTMYMSPDNGTTWSRDTAGIAGVSIARMCDDASNVVYAATGGNNGGSSALYRKNNGATSWSKVDALLTTVAGGALRISDFAANHTLELGTPIGAMSSYKGAEDWNNTTTAIQAEDVYSLYFLSGGAQIVSTGVGVFRKNGSTWTQTFPTTGFNGAHPIFRSDNPATLSFQLAASSPTVQGVIMSSTDNGATWFADTSGITNVPPASGFTPAVFAMDVNAKKYIAEGSPVTLYTSPSWQMDTTGFDWQSVQGTASAIMVHTDKSNATTLGIGVFTQGFNGVVVRQGITYRRSGSSPWALDSAGLNGNALSCMTSNAQSSYAASVLMNGSSSLYKRGTSGWQKLASAPVAISDASAISIDSSKNLFVAYGQFVTTSAPNSGIVATADEGATWQSAGLIGLAVRALTSTAEGTYAVTTRGCYKLALSVLKSASIQFALHQIDFGTVEVGLSKDTVVEVSNSGTDTLRVANLRPANTSFTVNPNSFTLAPGAKTSVTISFRPLAGGAQTATMRPLSNTLPDTVLLNGNGKSANAKLRFESLLVDLGTTDTKTPKDTVLSIGNSGTDTLIVKSVTCPNAFITASPTTFAIPPDGTHDITVRWAPTTPGSVVTVLRFTCNAPPDSLRILANAVVASVDDPALAERLGLSIGPNPVLNASAHLRCTLPTAGPCSIRLIDANGSLISTLLNESRDAGKLDLSIGEHLAQLASGSYYIRLVCNEGSVTTGIVVTR